MKLRSNYHNQGYNTRKLGCSATGDIADQMDTDSASGSAADTTGYPHMSVRSAVVIESHTLTVI